jgi:hypothetical protein
MQGLHVLVRACVEWDACMDELPVRVREEFVLGKTEGPAAA